MVLRVNDNYKIWLRRQKVGIIQQHASSSMQAKEESEREKKEKEKYNRAYTIQMY